MKSVRRIALAIAGVLAGSLLTMAGATAGTICNDGTYSYNSGRGTCSWHGGVNKGFPSYSDPGSSSWNRQNGLGSFNSRSSISSWNSRSSISSWNSRSSISSWNSRSNGLGSFKSSWNW